MSSCKQCESACPVVEYHVQAFVPSPFGRPMGSWVTEERFVFLSEAIEFLRHCVQGQVGGRPEWRLVKIIEEIIEGPWVKDSQAGSPTLVDAAIDGPGHIVGDAT